MANDLFPLGPDSTPWKKLTDKYVSVDEFRGQEILTVDTDGLRLLAEAAFGDINHLLRPAHLKQLAAILDDPKTTDLLPSTFSRMPILLPAACCRCARIPAPQ